MKNASVLLILLLTLSAVPAHAQVTTIPVRLQVTTAQKEVPVGTPVSIRVELKNVRNQTTPALEDVPITVKSDILGSTVTATIAKGQSGVTITGLAAKAGLATVSVESPRFAPSHMLLGARPLAATGGRSGGAGSPIEIVGANRRKTEVVRDHPPSPPPPSVKGAPASAKAPRTISRAPASAASGRGQQPALPVPPEPVSGLAGGTVTYPAPPAGSIVLQVAPDRVDPDGNTWTAVGGVAFLDADHQPLRQPTCQSIWPPSLVGSHQSRRRSVRGSFPVPTTSG
jgi:hypothetical protein